MKKLKEIFMSFITPIIIGVIVGVIIGVGIIFFS
tara:strand:+ start:1211 stop:1312 length:102 start_codon:yes stop_codon:yes gene_type:complete